MNPRSSRRQRTPALLLLALLGAPRGRWGQAVVCRLHCQDPRANGEEGEGGPAGAGSALGLTEWRQHRDVCMCFH